jgi:hypothetical protein
VPSRKPANVVDLPLAKYANYFEVGHNAHEFLLKFCQYRPEAAELSLVTTIVLHPTLGKVLHGMLRDALAKYEEEHGPLKALAESPDAMRVLFQSVPDFEQRAVNARLRPLHDAASTPKRTSRKR